MKRLLKDTCEIAAEIIDGKHDDDLDYIAQAVKARIKMRFRKGDRVKLVGTRNPEIDGKVGTVLKVNAKTVSVGVGDVKHEEWDEAKRYPFYDGGEFNVPLAMLEAAPR